MIQSIKTVAKPSPKISSEWHHCGWIISGGALAKLLALFSTIVLIRKWWYALSKTRKDIEYENRQDRWSTSVVSIGHLLSKFKQHTWAFGCGNISYVATNNECVEWVQLNIWHLRCLWHHKNNTVPPLRTHGPAWACPNIVRMTPIVCAPINAVASSVFNKTIDSVNR